MNFIEIKDHFFENEFVDYLFFSFPELSSMVDRDYGSYHVLGVFGSFFSENFQNDDIFLRGIKFINHSLDKGGHKTEDLIIIEVFEESYTHPFLVEKMKKYLSGEALTIFLKFLALQ